MYDIFLIWVGLILYVAFSCYRNWCDVNVISIEGRYNIGSTHAC
jgi:hypothetical protein